MSCDSKIQSMSSSTIFNSEIIHKPLSSSLSEITTLKNILSSCYGPFGNLHMLQQDASGHTTLTSISSRLLNVLSIDNILLKPIVTSTLVHLSKFNDHGLFCSLLILCILENTIKSSLPSSLTAHLISSFGELFVKFMKSTKTSSNYSIDLANVEHLHKIVGSVLDSKLNRLLKSKERKHLVTMLLKTFLYLIPEDGKLFSYNNINYSVRVGRGPLESKFVPGLLIRCPEVYECRQEKSLRKKGEILVALFFVSLAGDVDFTTDKIINKDVSVKTEMIEYLTSLMNKLIISGIEVVFCQKVIHPSVRQWLEDNDILVLDRLGTDVAYDVQKITGAVPVLSLSENTGITYGFITEVQIMKFGDYKYFIIQNKGVPFCSLFISGYNEEVADETKEVCKQAIDTLWRILKDPIACCGAGCSETYLTYLVKKEVMSNLNKFAQDCDCTPAKVIEALQVFAKSINDVVLFLNKGIRLNFVTDNDHHHIWELKNDEFPSLEDRCQCGMFSARSVKSNQWTYFNETFSITDSNETDSNTNTSLISSNIPDILDELSSKTHATATAFKTASLLLQVGLCVIARR